MKLLFASQNKHKVEEVKKILKDHEVISLLDIFDFVDIDETGETFRENAYLKASYIFEKYRIPTFSDDSGLCVDYLNGAPGVYSARFSESRLSQDNNLKLLHLLDGVTQRDAHFQCSICFVNEKGTFYFDGYLNGEIMEEEKGTHGFGYDPIFYLKEYGKTLAEIDPAEKNKISHRKNALEQFNVFLKRES